MSAGRLGLDEVHRFENRPVRLPDGLRWNVAALFDGALRGLRLAARSGRLASVGIDAWAVDYGLLDSDGALLGLPFAYRDSRTERVVEIVHGRVPPADLYAATGIAFLPFNTVYQLVAEEGRAAFAVAAQALLVPDLLGYWLTGEVGAEETNASTTGLLDARTGRWSAEVIARTGVRGDLLAPLRAPGDEIGPTLGHVTDELALDAPLRVRAVASHDTASAVAGTPLSGPTAAYVSCGTWALVGLELDAPRTTEAARAARFTNERGVGGTVRFLRNVTGLWLLAESVRTWSARGDEVDLPALLRAAAREPALAVLVDPDEPTFAEPGDMPARLRAAAARAGTPLPDRPSAVVRAVVDSLALALARRVDEASALADRPVDAIHLVGGGARVELLAASLASASGRPVLAGPVEASAIGNVLVQAIADGRVADLAAGRRLVAASTDVRRYDPDPATRAAWAAARERVRP